MTAAVRYRSEIDGLRAIAVGAVILNHFDPAMVPTGFLGVDIFFVISGYVISLSLGTREFGNLKGFLLGFYARRFKRLMPALILCVVVTAVLTSLFNPTPAEALKTGGAALFGLSNLYLWYIANDYFGGQSGLNSFTHTWSLGVEEQFYAVFPLILWRLRPTRHGVKAHVVVIAALAALSLALFMVVGAHQPMAAFYLMPLRFWELAAGCLLAAVPHRHGRPAWNSAGWVQSGVVTLLLGALFLPSNAAPFANYAVVALTAAALAVLAPGSLACRWLMSRVATYLGLISYSLYLWHWPVLVLSRFTIGLHWWSVPILAGLILLLAHSSYCWIERPLRVCAWAPDNGRTVLRGAAAAAIAAGLVATLATPLGGRVYAGRPAPLVARNVASLADRYAIAGTAHGWAGDPCILASNADVGKSLSLDACTLGSFDRASRRVMVLGNSYSAAFVHGFDALVRNDDYAVTIVSAWGASPIGGVPNDTPWSRSNGYYWNTVVPRLVSRLRAGDWVVLMSDLSDLTPPVATAKTSRDLALYRQGLRRLSADLARSGVRLAVLDELPFMRESGCRPEIAMPQWFAPGGGRCKFLGKFQTIARRRPIDIMLRQLQQDHQLVVIDPLELFCPGPTCTFFGANNRMMYRDEFSHPSVEAAQATAPLIRQILTNAAAGTKTLR